MSIKSDLEYYVTKRPGERVYIQDLESSEPFLGLTKRQLQNGMYQLARAGIGVRIITQGSCWVYTEPPVANPITDFGFTFVAESKNGTVILEDAKGDLWRAKKVD